MKYNNLGHSSIQISELSLGAMSLPIHDESLVNDIIDYALDVGINLIDTADMYDKGKNEQVLGKVLGSRRHKIVLATKVGNAWREDGAGWDWKAGKSYILKEVDNSLKRLNTDYIDLYQLHGGMIEDSIDDIIEAFESLVKQGKIRSYGISSIRLNVIREYLAKSAISSVMMQYSILDRRPEEVWNELVQKNVSILARGGLAQGLLAGKSPKKYLDYDEKKIAEIFMKIDVYADTLGLPMVAVPVGYVLDKPAISSMVIGSSSITQLKEIIEAYHAYIKSDPIDFSEIEELLENQYYKEHRK